MNRSHDDGPRLLRSVESGLKGEPESGGGQQRMLNVALVAPDPDQPRKNFDEESLEGLSESIRTLGIIQPIVVRRVLTTGPDGGAVPWRIIAGERRWRAAQMAGLVEVPVITRESDDKEAAALALTENACRADLTPIEMAATMRRLHQEFGFTQREIGATAGVDRTRVNRIIALLNLPAELHQFFGVSGPLTAKHGELLASRDLTKPQTLALGTEAATQGWSSSQLRDAIKKLTQKRRGGRQAPAARCADTVRLERELSEHLGTVVSVKGRAKGKGGDLVIRYYDNEGLGGILARIGCDVDS